MKQTLTTLPESILVKNQKKQIIKHFKEDGEARTLFINLRFDDSCGNGHNTFAITGNLHAWHYNDDIEAKQQRDRKLISSGCIHNDIAKNAPELEHLIKWHGCTTDGPTHYISNVLYHAGDLDCWGKKKGEPYKFTEKLKFDNNPFLYKPKKNLLEFIDRLKDETHKKWGQYHMHNLQGLIKYCSGDFKIIEIEHKNSLNKHEYQYKPKYSFNGMNIDKWHEAPFDTLEEANNFVYAMTNCKVEIISEPTSYGEGKERDLKSARSSAIEDLGLELSDEQLMLPKEELTKVLLARLPALMQRFKAEIEKLGFIY
jgi:hypothetical protein